MKHTCKYCNGGCSVGSTGHQECKDEYVSRHDSRRCVKCGNPASCGSKYCSLCWSGAKFTGYQMIIS